MFGSVKQSIYSTSCNQTEAVFRWTNIAKMIETSNSNATKALQKAKQSRSSAGKNVEDKAIKAQRQARLLLELGNQENVIHRTKTKFFLIETDIETIRSLFHGDDIKLF